MKVCLMSAGRGLRNNNFDGLHKALLPLENRAAISRILDKIDKSIEVVIALGYKAEQVSSYINTVHRDRKIKYVLVDNFDKAGSGPGYSLLCCKSELQEPFIFTSIDTLIEDDVCFKELNENWIGFSYIDKKDFSQYCLVDGDVYLNKLYYGDGDKVYIGMAGIYDYKNFWNSLEQKKIIKNEYQVIHGFEGLDKIKLINFKWHDTGNNKSYAETKNFYNNDIVANKTDEVIFIDNKKVIKYFADENKVVNRIRRLDSLNDTTPFINKINENMFCYDYINGEMLSNICDVTIIKKFFDFCENKLFKYTQDKSDEFINNCKEMYKEKTFKRLRPLYNSELDKIVSINGVNVEPIEVLINKIDWNKIYEYAIPALFHGDLQPENIIYSFEDDKFTLIDWRETFGMSEKVGDVYYDLSKLYHALLINGKIILNKNYDYCIEKESAILYFHIKSNLMMIMEEFKEFCKLKNYSWKNIELLGILHYLNICTLYNDFHGGKYGDFLFLYGKYLLTLYLKDVV